jgi:hypothetical protein
MEVVEVRNLKLWDRGKTTRYGKPLWVATVVLQGPLFQRHAHTSTFAKDELEAYTKIITKKEQTQ